MEIQAGPRNVCGGAGDRCCLLLSMEKMWRKETSGVYIVGVISDPTLEDMNETHFWKVESESNEKMV